MPKLHSSKFGADWTIVIVGVRPQKNMTYHLGSIFSTHVIYQSKLSVDIKQAVEKQFLKCEDYKNLD